jgi:hypothetical protein
VESLKSVSSLSAVSSTEGTNAVSAAGLTHKKRILLRYLQTGKKSTLIFYIVQHCQIRLFLHHCLKIC